MFCPLACICLYKLPAWDADRERRAKFPIGCSVDRGSGSDSDSDRGRGLDLNRDMRKLLSVSKKVVWPRLQVLITQTQRQTGSLAHTQTVWHIHTHTRSQARAKWSMGNALPTCLIFQFSSSSSSRPSKHASPTASYPANPSLVFLPSLSSGPNNNNNNESYGSSISDLCLLIFVL